MGQWYANRVGTGGTFAVHDPDGVFMWTVWIPPTEDGERNKVYDSMVMSIKCLNACTGMADPAGEIQRLRAERDRYEKAYAELTNAATRNGFVDSHGHIRKLLPASSGPTLYVTTDGCIVGNPTAIIYAFEMHPGCRFSGKIITMKYETWFATKWDDDLPVHWADNSPDRVWGCYSTRESAENAAALSANEADAPASKNTRSAYELKSSTSLRSVMDKAKEAE